MYLCDQVKNKQFLFSRILFGKEIKKKPAIGVEPITFGLQNRYSAN
jgi:hypothetical protein